MLLEDEQYELLGRFVEAHRNAPRESRGAFIAVQTNNTPQASFIHSRVQNLGFDGSLSDAEILADAGLLRASVNQRGTTLYSVLPEGIEVYEQRKRASEPVETVVNQLREFITSTEFRTAHPVAFAKWEQAESLLWGADSNNQSTTIGHLCREALQEFATSLARETRVDVSAIEPSKTVARLQAIIAARAAALGNTVRPFLDALVAYWGTVSDLVQRQEHGAQREAEALLWEDARRVVFQTCVVMFEVSRTLR